MRPGSILGLMCRLVCIHLVATKPFTVVTGFYGGLMVLCTVEYPVLGQVIPDYMQNFLRELAEMGSKLDVATYHFYPLLSERCLGPLPDPWIATPAKYLEPRVLNKVAIEISVYNYWIRIVRLIGCITYQGVAICSESR